MLKQHFDSALCDISDLGFLLENDFRKYLSVRECVSDSSGILFLLW